MEESRLPGRVEAVNAGRPQERGQTTVKMGGLRKEGCEKDRG